MKKAGLKVALVHDYLREYGGAERVLEQLHQIYPDDPVYTAFYDPDSLGEQASRFAAWDIRESKITQLPWYKKLFSPYRVLAAWAFQQFDFSAYDLVISSTNAYLAKAVLTGGKTKHLSYVHTPSRALWGYSTRTNWKSNPLLRVAGELINVWMRYLDVKTAQRPDVLVANSQTTAQRIMKFYRRQAKIIYPPVKMVDRIKATQVVASDKRKCLLFVGRLVLSKHPEIAVEASKKLNLPLKVVGTGIMQNDLSASVPASVEFLGSVDDDQLRELYRQAKLVIFPAEDEDFGIVPVESLAAGTPVVTHYSGELRFTINDGLNGLHVQTLNHDDWVEAINKAWKQKWDHQQIWKTAQKYSVSQFEKRWHKLVSNL